MSIVELLWPALVLSIALVYVHTIFGVEIIKRGVIFSDLAIGQIAASGMAISVAFMEGSYQNTMTLVFALVGAVLIAWATKRVEHVEAFIGLLYAFGISSIMLILAQSAEGMELFSKLSASDILFTSKGELYSNLSIYIFVALVMLFIYPKLEGMKREYLFFLMLAITVTSSVQVAGVLVVFALLIAPSYAGMMQKRIKPFLFATSFGTIFILLALYISYAFDMPTGYTIIFCIVSASLLFIVYKSLRIRIVL